MVPREWQSIIHLECALWKLHSDYYLTNRKTEGFGISADDVKTRSENYRNNLWLRKVDDNGEKPDPKKYFSTFVACIYCNRM